MIVYKSDRIQATKSDLRATSLAKVGSLLAYIEAVKPRETLLLAFIGATSSIVGAGGFPKPLIFTKSLAAVLLASAGVNGLTCYLDREWDARMSRTKARPLPSRRIYPAEKLLPFVVSLTLTGLALGYAVHPLVALAGAVGTITAIVARKTWITHYLGIASSLAPVWMGWLAVNRRVDWGLISISAMVAIWVLIHVWSLMLAYRDDYLHAGLNIFPVNAGIPFSANSLLFLSLLLVASAYGVYVGGDFGILYAAAAAVLSPVVVLAGLILARARNGKTAWLLYKFSAFPFLGLMFLSMAIDRILFS